MSVTYELSDLRPIYVAYWFTLTLSRSSLNVKVVGESSQSHEENVYKVVDVTLSGGRLHSLLCTQHCIFRPHRMHTGNRCGLLLQMLHLAWSVCLSL